ncbi:MAG: hypothetical protein LUH54_05525 [Firmicutes bacterium]|nr:hypothetical protein [Bacillota bacterium]
MNKSQKIASFVLAAITIVLLLSLAFSLASQWKVWCNKGNGEGAIIMFDIGFTISTVITISWLSVCHDILYYLADKSRKNAFGTLFHIASTALSSLLFVWCIYALNEFDIFQLGDLITSLFHMLLGSIESPSVTGIIVFLLTALSFVVLLVLKFTHLVIYLIHRDVKTRKIVKSYEAEHAANSTQQ